MQEKDERWTVDQYKKYLLAITREQVKAYKRQQRLLRRVTVPDSVAKHVRTVR